MDDVQLDSSFMHPKGRLLVRPKVHLKNNNNNK